MEMLCSALLTSLILCSNGNLEPRKVQATAQEASVTKIVRADANACETNGSYLDMLTNEARSRSQRVFVISRLGIGERRISIGRRRLQMARNHLITSDRLQKEQVVFAEGERVQGEGRLEFYLGSRLFLISLAQRNGNVCLTCCNDRLGESH